MHHVATVKTERLFLLSEVLRHYSDLFVNRRCAKIGAAHRGKKSPPHVIEAMRKARIGMKHTEEARRKMCEANRRRGTRPPAAGRPWTKKEDRQAMRLSTREAARRTVAAFYCRRVDLKD